MQTYSQACPSVSVPICMDGVMFLCVRICATCVSMCRSTFLRMSPLVSVFVYIVLTCSAHRSAHMRLHAQFFCGPALVLVITYVLMGGDGNQTNHQVACRGSAQPLCSMVEAFSLCHLTKARRSSLPPWCHLGDAAWPWGLASSSRIANSELEFQVSSVSAKPRPVQDRQQWQ